MEETLTEEMNWLFLFRDRRNAKGDANQDLNRTATLAYSPGPVEIR